MTRPAVLALLLTFVALVVATLWVPVAPRARMTRLVDWSEDETWASDGRLLSSGPDRILGYGNAPRHSWEFAPIWEVIRAVDPFRSPDAVAGEIYADGAPQPRKAVLAIEYALILAIGGLLALALETRNRKRAALQTPTN